MSGEDEPFAKAVGAAMSEENDARLERYANGELSEEELAELRAQAAGDEELALALELYAPLSDAAKARLLPSANVVRPRRWIAIAGGAAAALAAGIALFALKPDANIAIIRAKNGDELHLSCWPPGAPKAERCASGDRVVPSTAVMFHLRLGGDRQVMMLGRDGTGAWKRYFPRDANTSAPVAREETDFLHASLKLDATPGAERFVVFVSERAFEESEARGILDAHAAPPNRIEALEAQLEKTR